MAKGRNTVSFGIRVSDSEHAMIKAKAAKRGMTVSEFCRTVIMKEGVRSHHKKKVNKGAR